MQVYTANDTKQNFGKVMDTALRAPVSITKHGRPTHVITSHEEYDELIELKNKVLKEEVRAGFEQLDSGKFSTRSMQEIFNDAIRLNQEERASS